ncbi:hydrogenase expression/formation protein HypC [Xanthobacter flavus]|uniref:Hydrogenase maturation factor HypC n=1 Tax=Xanthobacter flavus TaxID=281 RepID=A0A9W6CJ01_XANFL|nr:HypC/HybG/HupF family hydrogenase formation chaperone [Xanthobacter flavus]MDR6333760.1 hydrogenase expression/formation protein HypC [Xanthobacter flavus]GLI20487.1 hydrogenase assembly protein HupF [Xanthobacter flavus]
MCLGIPGQIVAVADAEAMLCVVDVSGVRRTVDVVCVAEPGAPLDDLVGAWVLVHVGFAMSRIDEEEAATTLKVLSEIGEAAVEMEALTQGSVELLSTPR